MKRMNIGILGAGHIACKMAEAINKTECAKLYAVGARSVERAWDFAQRWQAEKAYGSYEQLVKDENVELIYVATPHNFHYEHARLCLEHGKNVICEKPFTVNAKQARELFDLAESKGLMITEALWTRFLPMRFKLDEIIASGKIGSITSLTANLGYMIKDKERLAKPELAGGALLDLGVYPINFALTCFGSEGIESITSDCVKTPLGVDLQNSIIIRWKDGKTAVLHSNMAANTDKRGMLYGEKGRIEFININNCEGITVTLDEGRCEVYETPVQINGFEYELMSAVKAVREHKTECPEMPHSETMAVMKIMDKLREDWGIKYPFE